MLNENSAVASYTPDIAALIDGDGADLIERYHEVVKGWHGLPPQTRLGFQKANVAIFIKAMESGIFDEAAEMGEDAAFGVAAIAMFHLLDMLDAHDSQSPKFLHACLGIAIGAEPRSEAAVAAEFGVVPATVSKWSRKLVKQLADYGLTPGRGMRREDAVKAYSDRAHEVWDSRQAA